MNNNETITRKTKQKKQEKNLIACGEKKSISVRRLSMERQEYE